MADEGDDITAKVKAVFKGLAGEEAAADAADSKPKTDQAQSEGARARESYDRILKWVLGVFSAVGLLIFGSVPFADLKNVSDKDLTRSLIAAGLGLTIVLLASTTAMEPQDASLGELADTFESRRNASDFKNSRLFPRNRASNELRKIMEHKQDGPAHLGPGIATVSQLISRLGELEKMSFQVYFEWNGGDLRAPSNPPAGVPDAVTTSPAVDIARAKAAAGELKSLQEAMTALAKHRGNRGDGGGAADVLAALRALEAQYASMVTQVADRESLTKAARIATVDELLTVYRQHREMVLDESVVAQMRGTFRAVRRWLMIGAALVLAGGLTFAHAVANAEDDPVPAKTPSAEQGATTN